MVSVAQAAPRPGRASTDWENTHNKANKITDWVKPGDKSGEFKRAQSAFRNWVSREPGARFPAEKGRYHLYVSYACPWVRRAPPHLTYARVCHRCCCCCY